MEQASFSWLAWLIESLDNSKKSWQHFHWIKYRGQHLLEHFREKIALFLKRTSLMQNQTLYKWTINVWKTMMP
jgi:hypothetical protein